MDSTTAAVRALYERYPYPSGSPELRTGFDARYVLSKSRLNGPPGRDLHVLDAGCGRATGLLGAARMQPGISFVGADMNRRAIQEARRSAGSLGLNNTCFVDADLSTMEGVPVPEGGFDVIHSSGVVHHMTDPASGLKQLTDVLAPHGVLVLMVYAAEGRQPIHRVARAIDAMVSREEPIPERLKIGRATVALLAEADPDGPWATANRVDDIEFVDRYLHIQEASYRVSELFSLLRGAGLEFMQWCSPREWDATAQLPPTLQERARGLSAEARFQLIEQITRPRVLELYAVHADNSQRGVPRSDQLGETIFAVDPEGTFAITTRPGLREARIESVRFDRADGASLSLKRGPVAVAGMLLQDQAGLFDGESFIATLRDNGVPGDDARQTLMELIRAGILYAPHAGDLLALVQ